jgi:uncharacterized membrane protein YedE/YeeE
MMGVAELFFFGLNALTLTAIYIGLRREVAPVGFIAGMGIIASIITMTLFLLQRVDVALQGIIFGIIVGAAMAIATLMTAWYFHSQERKSNN